MRKKKQTGTSFIIDVPIWDTILIVSIGQSDEEWIKVVDKYRRYFAPDYNPIESIAFGSVIDGATIVDENEDPVAIRLKHDPMLPKGAAVLAHELSHYVQFMLNRRGLCRSRDSEEAYAYTTSYLTRVIYENINAK